MPIWKVSGIDMIIMSSLVPFVGLLLLLFMMRSNPLFNKRQNTMFILVVVINLVMIVVVAADFLLSASKAETAWIWRRGTSFLNFACSPLIPLLLYRIFDKKKGRILVYLPAALNLVICFLSIFSYLVFKIGVNNYYDRGPLFFIPFATSLFYIAIIFFKPAKYQLRSKRVERVALMAIIGVLLLSMYLEIAFRMHFLVWNSSAIGLILYYLLLNIHNFILDPLTGVYNRVMYNKALNSLNGTTPCLIGFIDINDFKAVNDHQGHEAGDRCLIRFAELLGSCFQGCATLYRVGGDEFVLIAESRGKGRFQDCLKSARAEAEQADIRFACGIVAYDGQEDIETALRRVDQSMYEEKNLMKQS